MAPGRDRQAAHGWTNIATERPTRISRPPGRIWVDDMLGVGQERNQLATHCLWGGRRLARSIHGNSKSDMATKGLRLGCLICAIGGHLPEDPEAAVTNNEALGRRNRWRET